MVDRGFAEEMTLYSMCISEKEKTDQSRFPMVFKFIYVAAIAPEFWVRVRHVNIIIINTPPVNFPEIFLLYLSHGLTWTFFLEILLVGWQEKEKKIS